MKTTTPQTLLGGTLLAASLLAGTALACPTPIDWDEDFGPSVFPHPTSDPEIPRSASIHIVGEDILEFEVDVLEEDTLNLIDPDGEPVEWTFETSSFEDDVVLAQPVGGWLPGTYVSVLEGGGSYTIIDSVDEEAPDVRVDSWVGDSSTPPIPGPCGGSSGSSASIRIEMEEASEPVLYTYEVSGRGSFERSGVFFSGSPLYIDAEDGSSLGVEIRGFDLSGNSAEDRVEDATSCSGCSGSLAGGPGLDLAALGLGALLIGLRRRRSRS